MRAVYRGHCSFKVENISDEEQKSFEMLERFFQSKARKDKAAMLWHIKYDDKVKEFSDFKKSVELIQKANKKK